MTKIHDYEIHPAAELFPMMADDDLRALADDIKTNGQREYCDEYQGQLLDGRNRLKACLLAGVEPTVTEIEYDPDFDPWGYVISKNLHRRHLSESQRGIVAAKVQERLRPAAAAKQKTGKSSNGKAGGRGKAKNLSANLQQGFQSSKSAEQAAKMLNVSPRSVAHASTVLNQGSKDLIAKVERGEVSVSKAATIAKSTPKAEQIEAVEAKPARQGKTQLEHLKAAWTKASATEQAAFLQWVEGD